MKKKLKSNSGMSVIEVVMAMAIFFLFSASAVSLVFGSHDFSRKSEDFLDASSIAQDGLEKARAIFRAEWNKGIYNKSAIATSGDLWVFEGEGTSEQLDKFSRTIEYFPVYRDQAGLIVTQGDPNSYLDIYSKRIKVLVDWISANGVNNEVKREIYLTNWRNIFWTQKEWSDGGRSTWLEDGDYDSVNDYIATSSDNFITLKQASSSLEYDIDNDGIVESTAYNTGSKSAFSGIEWTGDLPSGCDGCTIHLQIKTAPDDGGVPGMWSEDWCGPNGKDGNSDDYFASSTGQLISTDHNGDQWIKYRAILKTNNTGYAPTLTGVKIGHYPISNF